MENLNCHTLYHEATKIKTDVLAEMGHAILAERSKSRLSLEKIASLSGGLIQMHQLERIEMGQIEPNLHLLIALSLIFGKKLKISFE